MKRTSSILLLFTLLQVIITSCSSLPSESEARKTLEAKISEESKGRIELLEFKKTNGLSQNMFGQEIYILEFNALIEFKEGGYKEDQMEGVDFNNFFILGKNTLTVAAGFATYFEKGKTVKLEGKIDYEKTENGWRPSKSMDNKAVKE